MMIPQNLMIGLFSYSSIPGLELHITVDSDPQYLTAFLTGSRPKGVSVIYCEYGNFWPEVLDLAGNRPPFTAQGKQLFETQFRYRGTVRDVSWDVFKRPGPPWRFGDFNLKRIYQLEPGKRYFVRGVYEQGFGQEKDTMRTRFHSFIWPVRELVQNELYQWFGKPNRSGP